MKMLALMTSTILACLIGYLLIRQNNAGTAINPSAQFAVPESQLGALKVRASSGDCEAARRLGYHFSFWVLDQDETIRWFRLAAKCPGIRSKQDLVMVLLTRYHYPGVPAEIESVIQEIQSEDPDAALRMRQRVIESRQVR